MATQFRHSARLARNMLFLAVALGLACGCRTTSQRMPLPVAPDIADPTYPAVEKPSIDSLASTMESAARLPTRNRPLEVLALTGGVSGAPYISGMLVGWTKSGTRPTFDVVTGISSGALIGMYAFLGPKYDADLERLILSLQTSHFIKFQPIRSVSDGCIGSSKPGDQLICREVSKCVMDDMRLAHAEGRRFFVGTMNVETRRLVVWDITAIAASGRPDADDLVRKVMLATFAWPGFVAPVEFNVEVNGQCYREQHYDGGSTGMMFVRFGPMADWPNGAMRPGWLAGSNLYVLANRKLFAEPAPVKKKTIARTAASVTAMFEAYSRSEMCRLHAFCASSGMRFHLMSEPKDHNGSPPTFGDLFPKDARPLFESGFQMGANPGGPRWRLTPPGAEPGEESVPRDGTTVISFR